MSELAFFNIEKETIIRSFKPGSHQYKNIKFELIFQIF